MTVVSSLELGRVVGNDMHWSVLAFVMRQEQDEPAVVPSMLPFLSCLPWRLAMYDWMPR